MGIVMSIIELNECDLPQTVWDWLVTNNKEEIISDFLNKETQAWLKQKGATGDTALNKVLDDYAVVATRYLITSNDIAEAISMGLSTFLLTPYENLVEDDEALIVKITTAFCDWFNKETGKNLSANISHT